MTNIEKTLLAVTLIFQYMLSFYSLDPLFGFDDANITQAYARNIANGHGYVYNIGGERVEGSTSLIWTAINTIAALTTFPIELMHAISFAITASVLIISIKITKQITLNSKATIVNISMFNYFPYVFGWGFFSLMDITLFILIILVAVYQLIKSLQNQKPPLSLAITCSLLPLVRSEGLLVSFAIFLSWVLFNRFSSNKIRDSLSLLYFPAVSMFLVTTARIFYFGYPLQNTFYAKTSEDLFGQFLQGVNYSIRVALERQNFAILLLFGLGVIVLNRHNKGKALVYSYTVSLLLVGSVFLYSFLGGDHFGGARFYQFIIPLALPVVSVFVSEVISKAESKEKVQKITVSFMFICLFILVSLDYSRTGGGFRHEFKIAKEGRQLGNYLNDLFSEEMSLAVITAGGIRMGYNGVIYDVMGLNWLEMAHSQSVVSTTVLKNHGAFDSKIFFATRPDIFKPVMQSCDETRKYGYFDTFVNSVTQEISSTDKFASLYSVYCNEEVTFYGLRANEDRFGADGIFPISIK